MVLKQQSGLYTKEHVLNDEKGILVLDCTGTEINLARKWVLGVVDLSMAAILFECSTFIYKFLILLNNLHS